MRSNKLLIIMAMLVVAIFAVGCVSAEENVTVDMDVPTEEAVVDDTVVEDVESEDATADKDVADEVEDLRSAPQTIPVNSNSSTIQEIIKNGGSFIFESGEYYNPIFNITLNNNTILDGNGVNLTGNGINDIFLINNCNNITIKNFNLNIYNAKHGIYGANVTNSVFDNLEIYNAKDGININEFQDKLTITNNYIHDVTRDGISIVNHRVYTDDELNTLNSTIVSNNRIEGAEIGIFVGGNFKGNIQNNIINNPQNGIEFNGKPIGVLKEIIGNITNNAISNGVAGIVFINETIYDLTIDSNNLTSMTTGVKMLNTVITDLTMDNNDIVNGAYGIYMTNVTTTSFNLNSNNFNHLNSALNIYHSTVNGLNLNSNDLRNMATGINMDNITISNSTFDSNVITGMSTGINMVNTNTNGLTIISNDISNMQSGINIVNSILDDFIVDSNEIINVNLGIGMIDTNIVDVIIQSNYINTNTFSNDYAILNDNVTKTGSLKINENYLRGCINHSLELMANEFDDNTVFVIVY